MNKGEVLFVLPAELRPAAEVTIASRSVVLAGVVHIDTNGIVRAVLAAHLKEAT